MGQMGELGKAAMQKAPRRSLHWLVGKSPSHRQHQYVFSLNVEALQEAVVQPAVGLRDGRRKQ